MSQDAIDRIVDQWTRERPDLDHSPTQVLQRITLLYLLESASFAEVFGGYGVTFAEYEVLAVLRRSGPPYRLNSTDLCCAVVLSSGAMTNRIDRLEAAGLVERFPDPDDRRGTLVALTERGGQVVDEALLAHRANGERLLSALTADERRQLADLLRKLLVSAPFVSLDRTHPVGRDRQSVKRRVERARRPR
jgi:DNA-binding MarR family transcriptional regulator